MRSVVTLAVAVAINAGAVAVLEWNVNQAQLPPRGEVTITQLDVAPVAPLAQVDIDGALRTAHSL
jgi:hypothetical protein